MTVEFRKNDNDGKLLTDIDRYLRFMVFGHGNDFRLYCISIISLFILLACIPFPNYFTHTGRDTFFDEFVILPFTATTTLAFMGTALYIAVCFNPVVFIILTLFNLISPHSRSISNVTVFSIAAYCAGFLIAVMVFSSESMPLWSQKLSILVIFLISVCVNPFTIRKYARRPGL